MPVVSIIFVTVLQMALKMSSSHFIDEHEGRTDPVCCGAVYSRNGAKRSLHVTVTRCFAAPRAAINERLAVYHSHNGVVVVHQVAMGYMSQPHAHLRALARSAFRDKSVALAVVSHERGVYKQGLSAASVKGKDKHERVVQSEASHVIVAVERTKAMFKLLVGL